MDQDQIESIEVYDPVKKRHFRISLPFKSRSDINNEEEVCAQNANSITIWTQYDTLALINLFALHKDKFKDFKNKKGQWKFISKELAKIGIHKTPEKCDSKWRNLLRVYRQHKQEKKGRGKFEFFNELDNIIGNDPKSVYVFASSSSNSVENARFHDDSIDKIDGRKRKCSCLKSDKQKRHNDRVALMTKKLEIEERKVKAFEDYLKYLKGNSQNM